MDSTLLLGLLNTGGIGSAVVFVFWMVATGKAATGREIKEKNDEITYLRETVTELRTQNSELIRNQSASVAALDAMRQAFERAK